MCMAVWASFAGPDFPDLLYRYKGLFEGKFINFSSSWDMALMFILISYVTGVIISTVSFYLIEKCIFNVPYIKKLTSTHRALSENAHKIFLAKVQKDYSMAFTYPKDMRLIITHVENKAKESYATGYIFMALYGHSRNMCVVFLLMGISSIMCYSSVHCSMIYNLTYGWSLILLSIVSCAGYIKFTNYFNAQILCAYLTTG